MPFAGGLKQRNVLPPAASCSCSPAQACESAASSQRNTGITGIDRFAFAFGAFTEPDTVDDLVQTSFNDNTTNDHFTKNSVECFEAKNKVQLADIFEEPIKGLDEDLNKI